MENNKKIQTLSFGIITLIIGVALFKQLDFEHFRFKKFWLGIVYLITFVVSILQIIKTVRSKN